MLFDFIIFLKSQSTIWLFLTIVFTLIDIVTIVHILINKHQEPTSAILWIFVVIDLHIIGVIIYLLLGINRIKTKGIKIGEAKKSMTALKGIEGPLSDHLEKIKDFYVDGEQSKHEYLHILNKIVPGTFPLSGNKVILLEDGTAAYPKMLEAIKNAQYHIHLQSFIIVNDETGHKVFNALYERAKAGVKVKVLFDRLGSAKAYETPFFKEWSKKHPNFKIRPFSKFNLLVPYRIQLRNHRKVLICDGKVAFVGGINISSDNDKRFKKNRFIHDLHCEITGPAVGEFQYFFLRDWSWVSKINPSKLISQANFFPPPNSSGDCIIRVNTSGPGQAEEATKKLFLTAVTAAQKHLWIITPYFVPDKAFIEAICMAAARKVDIKIIIPQNNNHWYVRYATRSIYNPLLNAGILIFEKRGDFSHSKAVLVDKSWGIMGSSNFDVRSFRLNYELDFTVEGKDFIESLYKQVIKELDASEEITLAKRSKRTFIEELLEDFCSLFTPVL